MFFKSREVSRIDQAKILQPLQYVMKNLHAQLEKLKKGAAQKPAWSVDALKQGHMSKIIDNIDAVIAEFNKTKRKASLDLELQDIGSLLIDIQVILGQIDPKAQAVIATPRNNQRKNVNKGIQYGLMGSGAVIGTVFAGPAAGAGLACGTGLFGYALRSKSGLSDESTASVKLLTALFLETETLLERIYRHFNQSPHQFNMKFVDEGKPALASMQYPNIYIYLDNGAIHYAFKAATGKLYEENLDSYLDKAFFARNDHPESFKYENLDALIFESYLDDAPGTKNNNLEIRFDALSQSQQLLIFAAVYKSLLKPSAGIIAEESSQPIAMV